MLHVGCVLGIEHFENAEFCSMNLESTTGVVSLNASAYVSPLQMGETPGTLPLQGCMTPANALVAINLRARQERCVCVCVYIYIYAHPPRHDLHLHAHG